MLLAFSTITINSATLKDKNYYLIYIGSDRIGRMFFANHLNDHQKKLFSRASKAEYRSKTVPSTDLIKRQLRDELLAKEKIFFESIRPGHAKKAALMYQMHINIERKKIKLNGFFNKEESSFDESCDAIALQKNIMRMEAAIIKYSKSKLEYFFS